MTEPSYNITDPIEAVADAWASIDGKVEKFRQEKALVERMGSMAHEVEGYEGRYEGYMTEAEELIKRVAKRGFTLVQEEE